MKGRKFGRVVGFKGWNIGGWKGGMEEERKGRRVMGWNLEGREGKGEGSRLGK